MQRENEKRIEGLAELQRQNENRFMQRLEKIADALGDLLDIVK